jgi:hypothetical protein
LEQINRRTNLKADNTHNSVYVTIVLRGQKNEMEIRRNMGTPSILFGTGIGTVTYCFILIFALQTNSGLSFSFRATALVEGVSLIARHVNAKENNHTLLSQVRVAADTKPGKP